MIHSPLSESSFSEGEGPSERLKVPFMEGKENIFQCVKVILTLGHVGFRNSCGLCPASILFEPHKHDLKLAKVDFRKSEQGKILMVSIPLIKTTHVYMVLMFM